MNNNFIGDTLFNAYKAIKTQVEIEFCNLGIGYGQIKILMMLFAKEECTLKQSDLVTSLGIDKSNASRNILKLKQKGYVDIVLLNKRDKGIKLTAMGKSLKPVILQGLNSISNKMTCGISEKDLTLTNQVLLNMKGNLE
jgi:DNA-binding MarR family transcriptional regulator